jgi:hypothetical protein
MTYEQKSILDALLIQDIDIFHYSEITFLIILSKYMRFANLTREESIKLQTMGSNLLDEFTIFGSGCPVLFNGIPVCSVTTFENSPIGSPCKDRPIGSGDGINFPVFGTIGGMLNFIMVDTYT